MTEQENPLHYLPPGWTEEEYANATDEDFENLPDDVLERNMERIVAEAAIQSAKNKADMNAERAERGLPSLEEEQALKESGAVPHSLVQLVEKRHWQDFGFMLFRMDYGDDDRWSRFVDAFDPFLESAMDAAPAHEGFERIRDKLFIKICDDDIVNGTGPVGVARAFQMFKEEGEVDPGLDTKMCLMADAECIASVIDARSDEDMKTTPPFFKAVDVELANGATMTPEYTGHFKVSIASLIPDFYLALREFGHPSELAPFAEPIWEDVLGSTA